MRNFEEFKNSGLLHKIAWSFHCTTGVAYDDLFSEASYLYCKALKEYDPSRGSITNYYAYYIHHRLINYLKQQEAYKCKKHNEDFGFIDDIEVESQPTHEALPFWESLSKEAQQIADIIFNAPKPFMSLTPEEAEERVVTVLSRKGWPKQKIEAGLHNLKLALSL
jgi:RNA polymerase sigma factor (sigma-70 family)